MRRPKRNLLATAEETCTPPSALGEGVTIARVKKAEGSNLYSVELPSAVESMLVELPSRFRSQIWIKRGGFVVVDTSAFKDRENKLKGEIVNIVRDEKDWRKKSYWPPEFAKKSAYSDDSEDEESTMGKLPPSDDSGSEERST
ncbi:hypothetical protein ACLMJK_003470 [Lecanora helva]